LKYVLNYRNGLKRQNFKDKVKEAKGKEKICIPSLLFIRRALLMNLHTLRKEIHQAESTPYEPPHFAKRNSSSGEHSL